MFTFVYSSETIGIIIGVSFGVLSRLITLRTDYRQYPTYPHGKIIHISLGVIAAALGTIVIPAFIHKNYTAVTFLSLAAQQFREVRSMERESLTKVDGMDLVPRGTSYIEGIAMVFEGRNYLVIFSAFFTTLFSIALGWYWGIAIGIVSLWFTKAFQSGQNLCQIADVRIAQVKVDGADVYVDSVYMMNVGLKLNQQIIQQHGFGLIVHPKTTNAKVTIANLGQRQAILHNLSTILGVYRDAGEPALIPMAKLDMDSGDLAVFILPQDKDVQKAIEALNHVPVLENAVRLPTKSTAKGK